MNAKTIAAIATMLATTSISAAEIKVLASNGVKEGARRPDIRTAQALKRTLLAADSITWAKEGQSGIYFADLLKRIGIAERMRPKIVSAASGVEVGELVASGKVQLGVI